jgi:hypothetical protein
MREQGHNRALQRDVRSIYTTQQNHREVRTTFSVQVNELFQLVYRAFRVGACRHRRKSAVHRRLERSLLSSRPTGLVSDPDQTGATRAGVLSTATYTRLQPAGVQEPITKPIFSPKLLRFGLIPAHNFDDQMQVVTNIGVLDEQVPPATR